MSTQPRARAPLGGGVTSSPDVEATAEPTHQAKSMPTPDLGVANVFSMTPPMSVAVTSGVAATLLAVLGAELIMPPLVSISAFVFVPVSVAGWLLAPSLAWPVVAVAAAIRLIALLEGPINPLTASAEILMLVTIGAVTMLAADRFRTWRAAETELFKVTARSAAAAEQDRIARQLTDDLARNLFATTLDLQSAMEFVEGEPARRRIATALARLDAQITDLRRVIFARSSD
jgi:signal transduction histidine kinase